MEADGWVFVFPSPRRSDQYRLWFLDWNDLRVTWAKLFVFQGGRKEAQILKMAANRSVIIGLSDQYLVSCYWRVCVCGVNDSPVFWSETRVMNKRETRILRLFVFFKAGQLSTLRLLQPHGFSDGFGHSEQPRQSWARMFAIFSVYLVKAAPAAGFISPVKKQQLINTLLLMETWWTAWQTDGLINPPN